MHHGVGLKDREPVVFCDGSTPSRGLDNGIVIILQLLYIILYIYYRLTIDFFFVEVRTKVQPCHALKDVHERLLALGAEGTVLLHQLAHYIPDAFGSYKLEYIRSIANTRLATTFSVDEIHGFIECIRAKPLVGEGYASVPPPISLLWEATFSCSAPRTLFLGPPSTTCLECKSLLVTNHAPIDVVCYTMDGPLPALKITLRCRGCQLNYRYDQYGNSTRGYRFYTEPRQFITASRVTYVERRCCTIWACSA